jgi:hypothetical protein
MSSETTESLAEDLLRGAEAIGAYVGLDARQTFYYLQTGCLPATKLGRIWISTKTRLRRHFNEARFEPIPKELEPVAPKRKRKS